MKKIIPIILALFTTFSFSSTAFAQIEKDQYYARSTLNQKELGFYDSCYNGALQTHDNIDVSNYGIGLDSAADVLSVLFIDSPELYFIDLKKELACLDNVVSSVNFKYNYPYNEVFNLNLQLKNQSSNMLDLLTADMTEYEKVKTIYIYLGETIEYDTDSANALENGFHTKAARESQTIIGGLLNQKAVCSGIARSLQYMMYQIDVPCYCVIGHSNGVDHVWNILQIDGQWYYADLTRDLGYIKHNVLLQFLYDDSFLEDHYIDESKNPPLPSCTSDQYMISTQIIPDITQPPLANPSLAQASMATSTDKKYGSYFNPPESNTILWFALIATGLVVLIVAIRKRKKKSR